MPLAFVQYPVKGKSQTSGTNTLILTVGVGITITAGNLLVLNVCGSSGGVSGNGAVTTVSDLKSNVWTLNSTFANGTASNVSVCSSILDTSLVAGDTITITFASTNIIKTASTAEFSGAIGVAGVAAVDGVESTNTGTGTPLTTAAYAPTNANDVLIAAWGSSAPSAGSEIEMTEGTGYTSADIIPIQFDSNGTTNSKAVMGEKSVVSQSGSYTATGTSAYASPYSAIFIGFKGALGITGPKDEYPAYHRFGPF